MGDAVGVFIFSLSLLFILFIFSFLFLFSKGFDDKKYCEKFYNHYESIGWVNGTGREIKNWKLVFNNWLEKDKKNMKEETINDRASRIFGND